MLVRSIVRYDMEGVCGSGESEQACFSCVSYALHASMYSALQLRRQFASSSLNAQ